MIRIPIARGCWFWIAVSLGLTVLVWFLNWIAGLILGVATLLLINFFRDPQRKTPDLPPEFVIAPADGKIISIEPSPCKDLPQHIRISIFMNIFDVHVNRVPVTGQLRSMMHFPGLFLTADNPRAPGENERMEFILRTLYGPVMVCLVAGLVARRIVTWARPDDALLRGQRFAMIKLGSRVDVHLPAGCRIMVQPGNRVKAGLTTLAELHKEEEIAR